MTRGERNCQTACPPEKLRPFSFSGFMASSLFWELLCPDKTVTLVTIFRTSPTSQSERTEPRMKRPQNDPFSTSRRLVVAQSPFPWVCVPLCRSA